mmetsp:Transcript_15257/g.34181  ORF Transcript_15257/g.34181 Transcript_15257/m.34181 type:complete len:801 (-) Transcript_15257:498-2900(-)
MQLKRKRQKCGIGLHLKIERNGKISLEVIGNVKDGKKRKNMREKEKVSFIIFIGCKYYSPFTRWLENNILHFSSYLLLTAQERSAAKAIEKALEKREALQKKKTELRDKIIKTKCKITKKKSSTEKENILKELIQQFEKQQKKEIKISYEEADGEGRRAMEQRIVSLVQSLSVVGRVLSRCHSSEEDIKPPVVVLSDKQVVERLWTSQSGLKTQICNFLEKKESAQTLLSGRIDRIVNETDSMIKNIDQSTILGQAKARKIVMDAFLKTRKCILKILKRAAKIERAERKALSKAKKAAPFINNNLNKKNQHPIRTETLNHPLDKNSKKKESQDCLSSSFVDANFFDDDLSSASSCSGSNKLPWRVNIINKNIKKSTAITHGNLPNLCDEHIPNNDSCQKSALVVLSKGQPEVPSDNGLKPNIPSFDPSLQIALDLKWDQFHRIKHQLESYADILLFYAHTSNFLVAHQYKSFESTPIEVYARELGNNIPKNMNMSSSLEAPAQEKTHKLEIKTQYSDESSTSKGKSFNARKLSNSNKVEQHNLSDNFVKNKADRYYEPDAVVQNVSRKYSGHFVLIQLLQWFNGGIGTNSELPHVLGCLTLPRLSILRKSFDQDHNSCEYAQVLRPQLVEWLSNPQKRGEPWVVNFEQLHQYFSDGNDTPFNESLFGSPILDLLIEGNADNIFLITNELCNVMKVDDVTPNENSTSNDNSMAEKLQSTVDEGKPAQGLVNWVQCCSKSCKKWRKLPWHVDVDLLPDEFFCKDNVWNPKSQSCDAPEDAWDEENETEVKISDEIPDEGSSI